MPDKFQFYSKSSDLAPGKGTGESLETGNRYDILRGIPGWRRILSNAGEAPFEWKGVTWDTVEKAHDSVKTGKKEALLDIWKHKFTGNKVARNVLLGTGDAELWSGKTRWIEGEVLREELLLSHAEPPGPAVSESPAPLPEAPHKRNVKGKAEMSEKKSRKSKTVENAQVSEPFTAAATGPDVTMNSPNLVTQGIATATNSPNGLPAPSSENVGLRQELAFTAQVEKNRDSSIRFCTVCNNYLYLHVDEVSGDLQRSCRNCGFKDDTEQGGLVSEMRIEQLSAEGYNLINEFTLLDPRLPHLRGTMKCVNTGCQSNKAGGESDIVYIKYDSDNLRYIYICTFCKTNWRSRR